jgi:hypothetical protein
MKKIVMEGRLIGVEKNVGEYESCPRVRIAMPLTDRDPSMCEDCGTAAPDYHTVDVEMDEESAREFASHMFDRVRVIFELIPTPRIIHGDDEEEENSQGSIRSSGPTGGIQDDDKEI